MGGENQPVRDVALHYGCEGEPLVEVPPDVGRLSEPSQASTSLVVLVNNSAHILRNSLTRN
jgi:hypothetical protein